MKGFSVTESTSSTPATATADDLEPQTTLVDDEHVAPTFAELGVDAQIVEALEADGKTHTFAIQELTLPLALAGSDLIGQARTGMGKTFGFGVPLLHRIARTSPAVDSDSSDGESSDGDSTSTTSTATTSTGLRPLDGTPRALVIVPTRELCLQVTGDLEVAAKNITLNVKGTNRPLRIASIYGGRPYESQIAELQSGVDVVVGTPGRLLDLAQQGHLILGKVQMLVLDEADEMLDLGFLPDIERIMSALPAERQTMLFSATMPGPIVTLARTFLHKPMHIRAEHVHDSAVHERTTQYVYRAHALDKVELLSRVLQAEGRGATMIFTRTKRTAQKVADDLAERGFAVGAVHGDLGQVAREKALKRFREGTVDVLVATDVAARGIDIDDVTHVINYQTPEDEKTYVHRIGRTGRAGRTGIAVTLVDWDELHRWELIDKALGLGMPEPVETYSSSAHLRSDLNIPEGVTGRVGASTKAPGKDGGTDSRKDSDSRGSRRGGSRGRGGASDGAGSHGAGSHEATDGERPSRNRNRSRRRTRGGRPAETAGTATGSVADGATAASADGSPATASGAPGSGSGESASTGAPRRRRRRGPRSGASSTGAGATSTGAESNTAQ